MLEFKIYFWFNIFQTEFVFIRFIIMNSRQTMRRKSNNYYCYELITFYQSALCLFLPELIVLRKLENFLFFLRSVHFFVISCKKIKRNMVIQEGILTSFIVLKLKYQSPSGYQLWSWMGCPGLTNFHVLTYLFILKCVNLKKLVYVKL